MICRTNLQARDLNQLARHLIKTAGALGSEEIEAHGHRFAVGDLVVTRVNDRRGGVRNLQRWQVTNADATRRELRLRRIGDQHEAILGAAYLDASNRHGQPALQHGYAVTAHVAQGSSHEQVFVQADTGIDRQWIRTALSRAKEQMRLYAVIGAEPVIAETGPTATKTGWPELTGSATTDRAETAAVDEKIRAATQRKNLHELTRRWRLLDRAAAGQHEPVHTDERTGPDSIVDPNPTRPEGPIDPDPATPVFLPEHRAEMRLIERELADRRRAQVTANRLDPPTYIREISEPPNDPIKAAAWTKASDLIERHRQIWGIQNTNKALADTPTNDRRQADRARTETQLEQLKEQISPADRETRSGPGRTLTPFEERWLQHQPAPGREVEGIEIEM